MRFFFWLVMHGRCWTAERRFRHGLQHSDSCIICDQLPETIDHLLVGCVYSREAWGFLLAKFHSNDMAPVQGDSALQWWLHSRKRVSKHVRRGFDSLFFLVGWTLWKERNARTFNGIATSPLDLALKIQEEANEWCLAGYRQLLSLLPLI